MKEYEISRNPSFKQELLSLGSYKELFLALSWRNIKVHFQVLPLGITWAILNPIILSFIYYLIFSGNLEGADKSYFLFVFSGVILWNFFAGALSLGVMSFIQDDDLVKKQYFPRFILPNTVLASKAIDLILSLFVLIGIMMIQGAEINLIRFFVFSTVSVLMLFLVTSGIMMPISALAVRFRNIPSFLPFMIHVVFFTSSAMYEPSLLIDNEILSWVFKINPVTGICNVFRMGIMESSFDLLNVLLYLFWSVLIFLAGLALFWFNNRKIPDYL